MIMNNTTYTNNSNATKANNEAFHKRLQHLYPCVDDVSKLPHAWSPESKAHPLGLTYNNLGCYFKGNGRREDDEKAAAAARTDQPIPSACLIYYFEIKFLSKGREGFMGVGLTPPQFPLTKLPGWTRESYGYHADDGQIFHGDGKGQLFGPTFTTGDVVGCGYNLVEGKCFFTKNGLNLGKAFDEIPNNIILYPTIGLKTPGEEVIANFGQEDFIYDVEQDLRSLKRNMISIISNHPIADFSEWQQTLHKLVQSWLFHNSYPKTAEAFSKSTKIEHKENMQRVHQRNRIQQLVLNGRISEAIRLTNRLCPNLLQNNPNLLFTLKCRQFVELISGAESDYRPIFNYAPDGSNGYQNGDHLTKNNGCNGLTVSSTSSSSSLQELMDIDQPQTSSTSDNNHRSNNNHINKIDSNGKDLKNLYLDTDFDDNEPKFAKLLQFGRVLSDYLHYLEMLYGKNEINEKMLQDTIGLIAFINPKGSCFGKLLDPSEREPLSQLLNNSIVKAEMGDSYRPPLEEVMNHLRNLVRLNDSLGGWLVDQLY